jgi:hypothetical protein
MTRSSQELLDLNSLQALDTCPNGFTDPDWQLPTFQPLINEPKANNELLLAQRCFGKRRLVLSTGDGKVPDGFELALRQAGSGPKIAHDDVGDVVGHGWWK